MELEDIFRTYLFVLVAAVLTLGLMATPFYFGTEHELRAAGLAFSQVFLLLIMFLYPIQEELYTNRPEYQ